MIKSSMLNNVRHSAMIRPLSHLSTVAVEPVLKFQDPIPAPGIGSFWLRLQNSLVQNIRKDPSIISITRLPNKLSLWMRNQNFRLQFHHLKVFSSGSRLAKLFRFRLRDTDPGPQPCGIY